MQMNFFQLLINKKGATLHPFIRHPMVNYGAGSSP